MSEGLRALSAEPLTLDEEAEWRGPDRKGHLSLHDEARLWATLDAERERARAIGTMAEDALSPTGDHHILPGGYCLDCQGGCILPLAEANTEAIRQAAYAGDSPFALPACIRCAAATYRPEPMGTRRSARRCKGCHKTVGNCTCPEVGSRLPRPPAPPKDREWDGS